jgi:signal transduction histidine kinase
MSIRGRLLALALGGALPLLIMGLITLRLVWSEKQKQLNEALEQHAELAAVVFDGWLDAQYQPLRTIASYPPDQLKDPAALAPNLKAALVHRKHWLDIRVLDASGKPIVTEPANAGPLASGLEQRLLGGTRRDLQDVETDWTHGEGHYLLAVAVPTSDGGAVVAHIDGNAIGEPLKDITVPERALITLLDQNRRVIYRSQISESPLGFDLSGAEQLAALNESSAAVIVRESSFDGVERVYGLSRVGNTGYVVMVGVRSEILYASAWKQLMGYAVVGLIVVFCTTMGALLIARSIARLEKREQRFAELDRLKSEFVSTVSHELRTPLTTIKALTRLLMRDGLDETKRREYVDTISVECDRQIELVLNLLDLSRIEHGVLRVAHERVDVPEVIAAVVRSETRSAEKRRHELRFEPIEVSPVCADAKQLRRVLSNVVENAIKYTPDGGRIVLSAVEQDDRVAIRVTDNGRGIAPEDMPNLFEKFHRGGLVNPSETMRNATTGAELLEDADVSGVGLGLYLARSVMERMGGEISVRSEAGRGSTFTLHLPVWSNGECSSSRIEDSEDVETLVSSG